MQRLRPAGNGIGDHVKHHALIIMHHNHGEEKPQVSIKTWGYSVCEPFGKSGRAEAHFLSGFLAK
ncbi:MAG: hypothetical protein ABSB30_06390 [Terracidiphilus sp.]|jgi:hypothetical protein